jgi:hypothetical protein
VFPRFHRLCLPGAVLAALALLPVRNSCLAQAPNMTSGESPAQSLPKPETATSRTRAPVPPVPGQLTNTPTAKSSAESGKRVPPILIAFVLLFLITWVRAYLERRRLRASFRQICEPPPP